MAIRAEKARRRFREFVRLAWLIAEPSKAFLPSWHIDAISDHLEAVSKGQISRLLITMPPGHAKSLVVSVLWPAWVWIDNPKWRALFSSYSATLATRDSVRCRGVIESDWYRQSFLPKWALASDQNVKSWFENTEKGSRMSLGVGGSATGFRGDAIVCDDPLNAKDQFSDSALESALFWWNQVMSSRLNDMATGAKVIIMQRLNERDLAGHVLKQGGYEHLNLPSEFEPEKRARTSIGWADPRTAPGELLFPALFPRAVIDQAKRDLGSQGFASQHQQRPSPAEGGILKRHWWQYWKPKGMELPAVMVKLPSGEYVAREAVELPASFDLVQQSWDMAFKDGKTSDYVVGQVHARKNADRYILDQVRDRMDMPCTVAAVKALSAAWPQASTKLVEDKANGPAVVQSLRHEIPGLIEVNPEGGKLSRAAAVSPEVEAGNWYLPHPDLKPWVRDFIEECAAFPRGSHDDQVDAWSQGGNRMRTAGGGIFAFYERQIEDRKLRQVTQ